MTDAKDAKTDAITKPPAKARHLTVLDYERNGKLRADKARTVGEFFATPERRARLARLSQGTINVEQAIECVLAAISKTPLIASCTLESIALAVQEAAELGLLPSGTLGLAHLVPFQNRKKAAALHVPELYEAKLIPDYKGLIHLARESGSVLSISAGVIYRPVMVNGREVRHAYRMAEGSEDVLEISPLPPEHTEQDADMIYAWAACKIPASVPSGYVVQWTYLTRAAVLKIKASSRASGSGPWVTAEPEMWKKTAVKRLSKMAPRRGRFARALEIDDAAEAVEELEVSDLGSKRPKVSRAQELLASLPVADSGSEFTDDQVIENMRASVAASVEEFAEREPSDEEIEAERSARKKT